MISEKEKAHFEALCSSLCTPNADRIGTYNEKAAHRVIKHFVSADESAHEVKVGKYFADVLSDGIVTEIQTGSFYPLKNKIAYYLENTEHRVRIIYPITRSKRIVRIDAESGEILRSKASPKKEKPIKILPELFWLSEHLANGRLSFEVYELDLVEYRYSDEVHRYRKSGRYDSETFPVSLGEIRLFSSPEDFASLLPQELADKGEFTAADFSRLTKIRGRRGYAALRALSALGILEKQNTKPMSFKLP